MTPEQWYQQQVDQFEKGILPAYSIFDLGYSPDLGLKRVVRAKVLMHQSIMRKAIEKHSLPLKQLSTLLALLQKPVRVFRSREDEKVNVFQLHAAVDGDALLLVAEPMNHPVHGFCHVVKSVHSRPFSQLKRWIDGGLLRFSTVQEDGEEKRSQISPQDSALSN